LAILVYFEQVRDDELEVEYRFGFPTLDRRLVIRKDTGEGTPAEGERDKACRDVFVKITRHREKEGRWPMRGGHQA
jgi:hypothetical protein